MTRSVKVIGDMTNVQMMFRQKKWNVIFSHDKKKKPDLLCFTGGMDISPALYGEKPLFRTHCHHARDKQDLEAYFADATLPKVGICRGGQLLNVLSGGSLFQHVDNHTADHTIQDLLFKTRLKVSSTHHQMMRPGPKAVILAIAEPRKSTMYLSDSENAKPPDVEPEVIWYEKTNSLCFQPHPEAKMFGQQNVDCRDYFFELIDYFF